MKICAKGHCTGCGLCKEVCPVSAISMERDRFGFVVPVVDENKCIRCGLCSKKCIAEGYERDNKADRVLTASLKDTNELKEVSSGGAFWAIAKSFIKEGGVVYGAVAKDIYTVKHMRAETIGEAEHMRRSKYLQSDITECYKQAKDDLEKGKRVLFSGTPCQIAALYSYVGENDDLFTCEIVCHGVPSALVYEKYIKELEEKSNSKIVNIVFRNKDYGWGKNHYEITFDNGERILEPSVENAFHSSYLAGMISRQSCSDCRFVNLPRTADIVLADYWQYKGELLEKSEGFGVSLLVCTTDKGNLLVEKAEEYLYLEDSTLDEALRSCRHLSHTPGKSIYREMFLEDIANRTFASTWKRYMSNGNKPADICNKIIRRLGYEKKRRTDKTD